MNNKIFVLFLGCFLAMNFVFFIPEPKPIVPQNNKMSKEKILLGKALFYENKLSISGSKSCASCHSPELAFTDGYKRSLGAQGYNVLHNAPGLQNISLATNFTYLDTSIHSLESQMLHPLFDEDPKELGLKGIENQKLQELRLDPKLTMLFKSAYSNELDPFTFKNIIYAIASYERTLVSFQSPYDQFLRGNKQSISASAQRGMDLFFSSKLNCSTCHNGLNLGSNGLYFNNGTTTDSFHYKVPSLRNVGITHPYMHNGSINTLGEVIDTYQKGGIEVKSNHHSKYIKGFTINHDQKIDLLNFLYSLTDSMFINEHTQAMPTYE